VARVLDLWERTLTPSSRRLSKHRAEIEWVIKYGDPALQGEDDLPLSPPRIAQLDLAYNDNSRGGLVYYCWRGADGGRTAPRPGNLRRQVGARRRNTRAKLRGESSSGPREPAPGLPVDWVGTQAQRQAKRTVLCKATRSARWRTCGENSSRPCSRL